MPSIHFTDVIGMHVVVVAHGNGFDAQFLCSADNTACNFAAVGNQQLGKAKHETTQQV